MFPSTIAVFFAGSASFERMPFALVSRFLPNKYLYMLLHAELTVRCSVAPGVFHPTHYPTFKLCCHLAGEDSLWLPCRFYRDCLKCEASPPSYTIHTTCLKLYLSDANVLRKELHSRLQVAAVHHRPWDGAPHLDLVPDHPPSRSPTLLRHYPELR